MHREKFISYLLIWKGEDNHFYLIEDPTDEEAEVLQLINGFEIGTAIADEHGYLSIGKQSRITQALEHAEAALLTNVEQVAVGSEEYWLGRWVEKIIVNENFPVIQGPLIIIQSGYVP